VTRLMLVTTAKTEGRTSPPTVLFDCEAWLTPRHGSPRRVGVSAYLPDLAAWTVFDRKINGIVRQEWIRIGARKPCCPSSSPPTFGNRSGRWQGLTPPGGGESPTWSIAKDRSYVGSCFRTHEEV